MNTMKLEDINSGSLRHVMRNRNLEEINYLGNNQDIECYEDPETESLIFLDNSGGVFIEDITDGFSEIRDLYFNNDK